MGAHFSSVFQPLYSRVLQALPVQTPPGLGRAAPALAGGPRFANVMLYDRHNEGCVHALTCDANLEKGSRLCN